MLDASGPTDNQALDYRFDFDHPSSGGWLDQDGQWSTTALSAATTFSPLENLHFTLSDDYGDQRPTVYSGLPLLEGVADASLRDMNYTTYGSDVLLLDNWTQLKTEWTPSEDPSFHDTLYYQYAHRLWRGQNVDFTYVPAADDFTETNFYQVVQHLHQRGNHTEITWHRRLLGLDNTLAGGGDVNEIGFDRNYWSVATAEAIGVDGLPRGIFPGGTLAPQHYDARADLYDLFAEDRLALTPGLAIVAGLRFDSEYANRRDLIADVISTAQFDPVSWRLGAVYTLLPRLNIYAQYATSTDSVGNLVSLSAVQQTYALTTGKQLEVGIKQETWVERLEWTFAAYRIIKNNLLTPDPLNVSLSLQVGQQSSRGLEAAVKVRLPDGWHLEANGTTLGARYDQFSETVSGTAESLNGTRPVGVPQQAANLWLVWALDSTIELQSGLRYVGYRYAGLGDVQVLPSYTVLDAGLRWTPSRTIAVDLHVNNALNAFYASNYLNNSDYEWIVGPPRTISVTLTKTFR